MVFGFRFQLFFFLLQLFFDYFFFSSRRRHTRYIGDWSSDVCSSDQSPLSRRLRCPGSVSAAALPNPVRCPALTPGPSRESTGRSRWAPRAAKRSRRRCVPTPFTPDRKSVV